MSESARQSSILSNLRRIVDSEWEKATVTNKSGSPDIKGHIQGHYISIEVKDDYNEPSAIQAYRIAETKKKGGTAFWSTSWNDTINKLREDSKEKGYTISFIDDKTSGRIFI